MSELKQRNVPVHIPGTPKVDEKSSTNIQKDDSSKLSPDFAIKVLYNQDKNGDIDLECVTHVKIILKLLQKHDFIVEIRPDTNDQFLLFLIKLKSEAFTTLVNLANETDSIFGIKTTPADKISCAERLRLINLKLSLPPQKGGCGIKIGENGVKDIICVGNASALADEWKSNWASLGKIVRKSVRQSDVAFLKENLGVFFALHYKFAQAYTSSIGCLGLFGIICWWFFGNFSVIYALGNLFVGFTTYLCIYASEKKCIRDWSLENIEKTQVLRVDKDHIDPDWKILFKKLLFVPVTLSGATLLFAAQFFCFLLEIFIRQIYEGPFQQFLVFIPTILLAVAVPVGTAFYTILAKKYLAFENNSTVENENKSLVSKLFTFNCLASYSAMLITAFIYLPLFYMVNPYLQTIEAVLTNANSVYYYVPFIKTKKTDYLVDNNRLSAQMFYFMVTNQIVAFIVEHILPQILAIIFNIPKVGALLGTPASVKKIDLKSIDDPEEHEFLENIRAAFLKPSFTLDEEYRAYIIQYGFLMLFGPIWSLGAFISFLFAVLQQETDYLKFIKLGKPLTPSRVGSSQPWVAFMKVLLVIGSFTSISIALMFGNDYGEPISSYTYKSSVSRAWFMIFPFSVLATAVVYLSVTSIEKVIDGVYDKSQIDMMNKEKKASEMLTTLTEKKNIVAHDEYESDLKKIEELISVMRS